MPNKVYTVKDVARLLGFSTNTVYKYLDEKKIKSVRFGKEGRFRIPGSEVARLLAEIGAPVEPKHGFFQGKSKIINLESHPKGAPSLFDWFIGFLSMGLGFSQFIFPAYVLTSDIARFLGVIRFFQVLLFISGAALIGFDVLTTRKNLWHNTNHIISGLIYLILSVLLFASGSTPIATAYLSVSIIIFVTAYVKLSEQMRFLAFINTLWFLNGLGVLVKPEDYGVLSNIFMVAAVWVLGIIFFAFGSWVSLRNLKYFKFVSFIVSAMALSYAAIAFSGGLWVRSIFMVIFGSFAIIFPFASHFESFTIKSKNEMILSFAWLGGLFFVGSMVLVLVYYSFQKYVFIELQNRVNTASDILITFMNGNESKVSSFASSREGIQVIEGITSQGTADSESFLRQLYLASNNTIRRTILINKSGMIVDTYPYDLASQGLDVSDRDYFKAAKEGKSIYVTNIRQPAVADIPPSVLVAAPISASDGSFLGVLVGSIDIDELGKRVSQVKFGKHGKFVLVDATRKYIVPPEPSSLIQPAPTGSLEARAVGGESITARGYDAGGNLMFMASSAIAPLGWGLVAEQPFSDAFTTYSVIGFVTFLVFLMSGVASLVLVIYSKEKRNHKS